MKKKLIHTPEGVRDIYGEELKKKIITEKKISELISNYGYEEIETPTFEFFDIFSGNIGTIPSKELYKFFDKEGNTLALRPDFTPSIARAISKYFTEETMPLRFCYRGSTFNNTSDYQGRLKESTEIGVELINDGSVDADVEMLMLTVELLKRAGLKEFQVSVGNLEFFKGLCNEFGIDEDNELQLREMINDKNYFGTQDILDSLELKEDVKEIFGRMPEMFGGIDTLKEAKSYVTNKRSIYAIRRLEEIYDQLKKNGIADYISFDLGMLSKYNYYTGIIFRAYTYGSGDAVIKGGRYDNLLSEFGKKSEAVGFCILIDQLMSILSRLGIDNIDKVSERYLIAFNESNKDKAYEKAHLLRTQNKCVIMINEDIYGNDRVAKYASVHGFTMVLP
ncbi:MAG: ATP phosphoribosyltransferase regulatory subunit [Lachnospiraceae bacterium]|nr:ATP phosphoribosyltransferase regulatory subunit [Lachnospiraceae bacterium]